MTENIRGKEMANEALEFSETAKKQKLLRSTRHELAAKEENWSEEEKPRLGRRESEPHSMGITYLYDVLTTNFPNDRVLWDLHHYFTIEGEEIDIQFDISYFRNFTIPYTLSSYRAKEHGNRIPTMAINILSKSTFYKDIGITVDRCWKLGIPVYVVFNPYLTHIPDYKAPFLRVYLLDRNKEYYSIHELRNVSITADGKLNPEYLIDCGDVVPFKMGLRRLSRQHQGNLPIYQLIFVDSKTMQILKTKEEIAKERAQKAEEEAKRAKERAQKAEEEAKRAKEQLKTMEAQIKRLEEELKRFRAD